MDSMNFKGKKKGKGPYMIFINSLVESNTNLVYT